MGTIDVKWYHPCEVHSSQSKNKKRNLLSLFLLVCCNLGAQLIWLVHHNHTILTTSSSVVKRTIFIPLATLNLRSRRSFPVAACHFIFDSASSRNWMLSESIQQYSSVLCDIVTIQHHSFLRSKAPSTQISPTHNRPSISIAIYLIRTRCPRLQHQAALLSKTPTSTPRWKTQHKKTRYQQPTTAPQPSTTSIPT